ncbi:cysteine desulfurase family protein [Rhabdochlamydiaceae symbiont of Dictyostelium giganteum]|uniref:cysteine desulfurase family protein n=1 Tax=Rhabdochlamydiaceae symbiont of Dictyostelium giganteum TaxID=3342349 RepID=UPI00384CAFD5
MKRVYLDNNATTQVDYEVVSCMQEVLLSAPLNPSSTHSFGQEAKHHLTRSRDLIAKFLHVQPKEIIFTSGGTEALNSLIQGFYALDPECHIISSNGEHPAVQNTLIHLQKKGAKVSFLPIGRKGSVEPHAVQEAITPHTRLIVLMAVNNITGVKTDIDQIAVIAEKNTIPFIVDGVQILGKELFKIPKGVSAMAFSSHKIHGPQGVGACFLRSSYKIPPLIIGGGQELGRRSGTENIAGIVGFAKAIDLLHTHLPLATEKMERLKQKLILGIRSFFPQLIIHGEGPFICNTVQLGFPSFDGETLLLQLDLAGIAVSHGSACTSGGLEPSPILLNMGVPPSLARASLRFSLSRFTTEEEIDQTLLALASFIQ